MRKKEILKNFRSHRDSLAIQDGLNILHEIVLSERKTIYERLVSDLLVFSRRLCIKLIVKPAGVFVRLKKPQVGSLKTSSFLAEAHEEINSDKAQFDEEVVFLTNNKKLIVIHAFYLDELLFILNNLHGCSGVFDIFITTPSIIIADYVKTEFGDNNSIRVFFTENKGRDVFPFIKAVNLVSTKKYIGFIKVHTKRSPHRADGRFWFRSNIRFLLSWHCLIDDFVELVGNNTPALIGVELLGVNDHYDTNKKWMNLLIGPIVRMYSQFIPGTMFAGNRVFLDVLKDKRLSEYEFEQENKQLDGTLAHALERYFGYLCSMNGGDVYNVDKLINKYSENGSDSI